MPLQLPQFIPQPRRPSIIEQAFGVAMAELARNAIASPFAKAAERRESARQEALVRLNDEMATTRLRLSDILERESAAPIAQATTEGRGAGERTTRAGAGGYTRLDDTTRLAYRRTDRTPTVVRNPSVGMEGEYVPTEEYQAAYALSQTVDPVRARAYQQFSSMIPIASRAPVRSSPRAVAVVDTTPGLATGEGVDRSPGEVTNYEFEALPMNLIGAEAASRRNAAVMGRDVDVRWAQIINSATSPADPRTFPPGLIRRDENGQPQPVTIEDLTVLRNGVMLSPFQNATTAPAWAREFIRDWTARSRTLASQIDFSAAMTPEALDTDRNRFVGAGTTRLIRDPWFMSEIERLDAAGILEYPTGRTPGSQGDQVDALLANRDLWNAMRISELFPNRQEYEAAARSITGGGDERMRLNPKALEYADRLWPTAGATSTRTPPARTQAGLPRYMQDAGGTVRSEPAPVAAPEPAAGRAGRAGRVLGSPSSLGPARQSVRDNYSSAFNFGITNGPEALTTYRGELETALATPDSAVALFTRLNDQATAERLRTGTLAQRQAALDSLRRTIRGSIMTAEEDARRRVSGGRP